MFAPYLIASAAQLSDPPRIVVTADNTQITRSCIIEIPPGISIPDADGNGVIHITAPGIRVEFAKGSELWGGPRPSGEVVGVWDSYSGTGIRVDHVADVSLVNLSVHGYKVGIWAEGCNSLSIADTNLSDNFRQRLRSTPLAEDASDWLYPHHNDNNEWPLNYGAALFIKSSANVTVRGLRVRRGQNGIALSRVTHSRIFDNDCSFLSGWGLALFRSSHNTISRNAFDFCVRGHSEGVYNRGQDSAGILAFEQCSNNVFVENSCTHGGDAFFGFAGLEALNGENAPPDFDHTRKGCNDNLFLANDLSYAPAHGWEMTFSFGNRLINNRLVENAICGVWGGYSQDTLIAGNTFTANGGMTYGLERGAINIEHGSGNLILDNRFLNNRVALHLWFAPNSEFQSKPWSKANYRGVVGNHAIGNTIDINAEHPFKLREGERLIGVQFRDEGLRPLLEAWNTAQAQAKAAGKDAPAKPVSRFQSTVLANNTFKSSIPTAVERVIDDGIDIEPGSAAPWDNPRFEPLGSSQPVGARPGLRGRSNIVMHEWGPWDHQSPIVRLRSKVGPTHTYEVFGAKDVAAALDQQTDNLRATVDRLDDARHLVTIFAEPGVNAYTGSITLGPNQRHPISGTIIAARWDATFFSWKPDADPREHPALWRALASAPEAVNVSLPNLKLNYAMGGPKDQPWAARERNRMPGSDRFGMIASSKLVLPKGRWRITTLSDDGVRVLVGGNPVIENWTWHAPTRNEGVFDQPETGPVELTVEHFEIDGFAVLELDLSPG